MPLFKIKDIADEISVRVDDPKTSGYDIFVGLEHYDSGKPMITRYGSTSKLDSSAKVFESGDILIARRNVYLKRAGLVQFKGLTSGDSIVIRAKKKNIQKLLPFIFNTTKFWDYASKHADGSMSKRLSPKNLMEFEVNLPSNDAELEKLSNLLWSMYESMNSYEDVMAKSDDLIKSQFIEMFGDVYKNDKGFKECCFGDFVSKMNLGPFGSDLKNDCFVDKEYGDCMVYEQKHAIEKTMDLPTRYVTKEKHEKLKKFEVSGGDILVSCRGTIGQCYIIPDGSPVGIIHPSLMMIKPKATVNTRFLLFLLEDILSYQDEQGSGVKMAIKASELSKIKTIDPGIELQNEFVEVIEQIDKSKFMHNIVTKGETYAYI